VRYSNAAMTACIISVAITGSVPTQQDNPAVPLSVAEQVESTQQAFEAGAALVHVHVRDDAGAPSSDPERFAAVLAGVRQHCPGMIVQFSTGGRGRSAAERGSALALAPDMASLATGSVNFPDSVYENSPALIDELAQRMLQHGVKPEVEIFDLAMLYNAAALLKRGLLIGAPHVQFVLGLRNALPARRAVLEFLISELKAVLPMATWTAAGIGRQQLEVNHWAAELGGHCRTGLEDNVRFDATRLASSNAELVARVVDLLPNYGRTVADAGTARALLGLSAVSTAAIHS
jgi:3-keto-5-aminohexanoate cleavage enzyme